MSVAEARANLWAALFNDEVGRDDESGVSKAIDALIAAVREELTAPGPISPEDEQAERWLHSAAEQRHGKAFDVMCIVDSLRARLAQAESEKMSLDAQLAETSRQLDGMRLEYRNLQAKNAELHRYLDCLNVCHVCGCVLEEPDPDGSVAAYTRCEVHASMIDDEEDAPEWHIPRDDYEHRCVAAARRAWK